MIPALLIAAAAFAGDLDVTPGAWAEYLVRSRGAAPTRVRFSVLPTPAPEGRHWLEMATIAPGAPPQAVRLLLRGRTMRPGAVERMEIYLLGQAPIAIPVEQVPDPPADTRQARRVRQERVRTRAGTFTARVFDLGGSRVWRSDEVPLWGLLRSRSPRETIELLASSRQGAHTVFPEDPR